LWEVCPFKQHQSV